MAFKGCLDCNKLYVFCVAKFLFQGFECWKPSLMATRAPGLKEVEIRDFTFDVVDVQRFFASWQADPFRSLPLWRLLSNDSSLGFWLSLDLRIGVAGLSKCGAANRRDHK